MEFLYGLVQLGVALIALATWQRSAITGFLWIAFGLVLDTLAGWVTPLLFPLANTTDGGVDIELLILVVRLLRLATLAVVAIGFWKVYAALKRHEGKA
ncbi:hypothetical protein P873_01955 [Arenimonas composti TR7-09 = DSM 18010]|uniref:Uncharacterized protein n=2 Tax=Arenimonas TaxID=490567 RepID=A0A091B412_9GAMM|nr:hypothetical protein P873_01955 [Arenimonas composti TR7-09 = DSM 18010]